MPKKNMLNLVLIILFSFGDQLANVSNNQAIVVIIYIFKL